MLTITTEINNYRPSSLLPAMSKIPEKVMYKRVISFLNQPKVFVMDNLVLEKTWY